jgi:hypothetical protein
MTYAVMTYAIMGVKVVTGSSENGCQRIALLGQVSPSSTLRFVIKSREKAKVSDEILSENFFERKLGRDD